MLSSLAPLQPRTSSVVVRGDLLEPATSRHLRNGRDRDCEQQSNQGGSEVEGGVSLRQRPDPRGDFERGPYTRTKLKV